MSILTTLISVLYYAFIAFIVVLILYNLIKTKDWKKEIIYVVILIPFLLRLLMLK
ncbi:MAG: hypothetical protein J7L89_05620 [Bacteroidales bacterium]|nr:hypothetical protein [Bacteroidales bacterium]